MSQGCEIIQRRLLYAIGCPCFRRSAWAGISDRHAPDWVIGMLRIG